MNPRMGMAAAAYRKAATSVHPTVAVVRIYDEIIITILQAIRAKENRDHEQAFTRVLHAAMILRGLSHSLDFANGGAVADRLFGVYKTYILQLHLSYGKPDVVARYRKLLDGLIELRDAWASIAGMPSRSFVPEVDAQTSASLARIREQTRQGVGAPRFERPEAPVVGGRLARGERVERPRRSGEGGGDAAAAALERPLVPRPKKPGGTRLPVRDRSLRVERPPRPK